MLTVFPVTLLLLILDVGSFSGTIVDQDGKPISGAVVQVYTGVPKDGPALLCPSCYPDCGKQSTTKSDGTFLIDGIATANRFTLVVGATGYCGTVTGKNDPSSTEPLSIQLKKHGNVPEEQIVRGKVVDLEGKPAAGTHIEVRHYTKGNLTSGSVSKMMDPLTITDNQGEFRLTTKEPLDGVMLRASMPGYASNDGYWDSRKRNPVSITLGHGACVQGKLVYDGKPLINTRVGIVQRDRGIQGILTPLDVVTDADGFFSFENLPPAMDYVLYTHANQQAVAALAPTVVTAPDHNKTADFETIEASKPLKLTITVKTLDGSALPPKSGLYLGSREAWHGTTPNLSETAECVIVIDDLPKSAYRISFRVPGFEVHQLAPNLQPGLNRDYELTLLGDKEIVVTLKPIAKK